MCTLGKPPLPLTRMLVISSFIMDNTIDMPQMFHHSTHSYITSMLSMCRVRAVF